MLKWKAGHKAKKGGVKGLNHPKGDVDAAAVLRDELGAYDDVEGDPSYGMGEVREASLCSDLLTYC